MMIITEKNILDTKINILPNKTDNMNSVAERERGKRGYNNFN